MSAVETNASLRRAKRAAGPWQPGDADAGSDAADDPVDHAELEPTQFDKPMFVQEFFQAPGVATIPRISRL